MDAASNAVKTKSVTHEIHITSDQILFLCQVNVKDIKEREKKRVHSSDREDGVLYRFSCQKVVAATETKREQKKMEAEQVVESRNLKR